MAENIRSIEEILNELFKGGRDSAIEKYAKVRHTQYEMDLWCHYGLPLSEVERGAKAYFSKRFLNGCRIDKASEKALRDAFSRLDHAVNDGCHGRCHKLIVELNQAFAELGLPEVKEIDKFLDWLTFNYQTRLGGDGEPVIEKPYGFQILIFDDERNRKEFWTEVQQLIKAGRMASVHDIATLVVWKRKHTVSIK